MPADRPDHGSSADDIFDQAADRYDAWYDSPTGALIFASELDAIQPLVADAGHPWLEVGVGTGRFAAALGVEYGVDPASNALTVAANRGIDVAIGRAEQLSFDDAQFGAVLFVATLCFVADARAALTEARRVLQADGVLVLGTLPAEGRWAQRYSALARQGNPYYERARFFTRPELFSLLGAAGFQLTRLRTALFWDPESEPITEMAREGDDPQAGFLAVQARPR